MNIAERLQKEAQARKKQEVEKFSSGYTAMRELYEQEYKENKNKLSSEIKQDIKLISQKYPSFQKFALYRIYKQFDFNREIANEFISIQIQKEEQPDQGDDWIEVTSKKSAFIFKIERENNKPQRSQSVPRTTARNTQREKKERNTDNSQERQRNNSQDRRRNNSTRRNYGERDEIYKRRYSPKREQETRYRYPKQQNKNSYSYQPRIIYVPKTQEIEEDCPYVVKSTIRQIENQISKTPSENTNEQLKLEQLKREKDIEQQREAEKQREAQIEKQRQEQLEEMRKEQIRNEQKRQEELRIEQIRLEQLENEKKNQEQERLRKQKAEQDQQRLEQQKIEEQKQYEQMLQQQQAYQKQFVSNFQPARQVNHQGPQQYYQPQNQQQSVYHMLMSYINYQ